MRLSRALVLVPLCAFLALPSAGTAAAQDPLAEARRLTREAQAAYEAGDYAGFRDGLQAALRLRPDHPGLTFNLAAAYALNGEAGAAVRMLQHYAAMGLAAEVGEEPAFAALRGDSAYAAVLAQMEANRRPVGDSEEAFRLADPQMIPEGIAYDPQTGAFFVGSVRQRRIVRYDEAAGEQPFASAGDEPLWSVLGMDIDADRRIVWAATAAMDQTLGVTEADRGRTALVAYDLDRGARLGTYALPPAEPGTRRALGDVTVARGGDVYATDGAGGQLYVLRQGAAALEPVLPAGTLVSPQGLCFAGSPEGDGYLYLADYALGLLRVDPAASRATPVAVPAGQSLLGVDGLACAGRTLVAVQNGVRPQRVLRLHLDAAGEAVTQVDVLAANDPRFDEPTLGVVVGPAFYYVGNSQWSRFDRAGNLDEEGLQAPIILKLDL